MRSALRSWPVLVSAVLVPVAWIGFDLVRRPALLAAGDMRMHETYAAGAVLSVLVWGFGMESARHPRRAVRATALFALGAMAAFGIGLQLFAHAFTHAYVGRRALLLALSVPNLLHAAYFQRDGAWICAACLVPAALAVVIAVLRARRFGKLGSHSSVPVGGAAAAALVAMFVPLATPAVQAMPPDVLWINGMGGPMLHAAGLLQKPKSLPIGEHEALSPAPRVPVSGGATPSIVLILGESLRRDSVCSSRSRDCPWSPRVDEAAPDRIGFSRAFSVASCTELASTALFTGLSITAAPDKLARAPLLWDYAKSKGYRTAYITSQNLLYQQADQFLRGSRIDLLREARDRTLDAPVDQGTPDEDLTQEALSFIEGGGPAFVVVHQANTHAPYRVVPGVTAPVRGGDSPGEGARARYRDSLAHNDVVVADFLTRLRQGPEGRRAIVLFTSDHGEAFGEHGAFAHSFDLHAEQTDVPFFVDAGEGALSGEALSRLRADAPSRPVSTTDIAATVLDLLGALDEPAFRARTAEMAGTSLLRPANGRAPTFLWNCPPTRECPAEAFGVIDGTLKLQYVGHDSTYACHDIEADPGESRPLAEERCAHLRALLDATFGERP
ncbi:MAG: sulfatase-like hydrolase/transferase [Polyangiaceae bacterium]